MKEKQEKGKNDRKREGKGLRMRAYLKEKAMKETKGSRGRLRVIEGTIRDTDQGNGEMK